MSHLSRKWQQLYPSDQLLFVVRAAQLTSDVVLFQKLLQLLDQTISNSLPSIDLEEIKTRLQAFNGSVLEPFTLSEKNLELAGRLAQLAFSKRYAQSRFRVISEQSIGCRGGVVLCAHRKDHYVKRLMRKDDSFDYRDCWFWAPSFPVPTYLMDIEVEATVKTSAQAAFLIEVDAKPGRSSSDPGAFRAPSIMSLLGWARGHIGASVMNGETTVPLELNVVVQSDIDDKSAYRPDRVLIKPTSPESIMRFSALLASRSELQIDSERGGPGKAQLRIKLALPESGPTILPTEIRRTSALFDDAFKVPHDVPIPLESKYLNAVLNELSLMEQPKLQESKAA